MLIKFNNTFFNIIQFPLEPPEIFTIRSNWIVRKNPSTTTELHYWVKQSRFIFNILMYNCTYSNFLINDTITEHELSLVFPLV